MNNPQESVDHFKSHDYRTIEQTMEKLSGGTRRLAAQLKLQRVLILCGMF